MKVDAILKSQNFSELNPMQQEVIALGPDVKDIVLLAPTGSGKTIAYLTRLIFELQENSKEVQALIISPARELVIQIESVFKSLKTGFSSCVCYGGHNSRIEQNRLAENPDVIIATPGRLSDHITNERINTKGIRLIILDEFDKSLEMGFHKDLEFIFNYIGKPTKHILTSATNLNILPGFLKIKQAEKISYLVNSIPEQLSVRLLNVPAEEKAEYVLSLVAGFNNEICIVFCNHRDAVERISQVFSKAGFSHGIFHGAMEQIDRERNLIKFRSGACTVLISTDLASRGLDIPEVKHIVHYQMPIHEEAFIHRNGRTARMHAQGDSYLILGNDETLPKYLNNNIQTIKVSLKFSPPAAPEYDCIYFSAGKKEKISKGDLVGLILKKGGLLNSDLGLITILDNSSYVAINRTKTNLLLQNLRGEKLKKSKVKIEIAR
ncbi:MAG: DEAD/DEAH box helicase [Bacteroidia bacterium]